MNEATALAAEFDELIALLKKIRFMAEKNMLNEMDTAFVDELSLLLNNYDLIKSSIHPDLIEIMGKPIFEMAREMVQNLKTELLSIFNSNKEAFVAAEIHEIDVLMSKQTLSLSDIDSLLDKRITLMSKVQTTKND